ncbi:MAG: complex I subunit 5 family protein [Sphaerochaeta sp.]
MSIESLFLSPVYLPMLGAALILVAKHFGTDRQRRAVEYLSACIAFIIPLIAFIFLIKPVLGHHQVHMILGTWETTLGIHYHFDGLSFLLITLNLLVSIPVWLYSRRTGPHQETFTVLFLIQSASIAATSLTADLFNLFVCLEVMGVTSYALVASSEKEEAILSSFTYLMFSATAMVFFLLGTFGLYRISGSLAYDTIAQAKNMLSGSDLLVARLSLVLIVVSVLLRTAVIPLSGWLVGAHSNAPHAVSALLSGLLIKIPLFALVRLLLLVTGTEVLGSILAWAGGISSVVGILLALREHHTKRLLAYSSVSQIGYVVAAYGLALTLGLETEEGAMLLALSLLYAFSHALAKATLFMTVGRAGDAVDSKDLHEARGALSALRAQGERFPFTGVAYLVAFLSISALPPTIGFWGKNTLVYLTKGHGSTYLLSTTSVLTIVAYLKLSRIFLPRKGQTVQKVESSSPDLTSLSLIFLTILLLAGGFWYTELQTFVLQVLSPLGATNATLTRYSALQDLQKTGLTFAIALLVFFIGSKTRLERRFEARVESTASFSNLFFGFALMVAIMAWWLLIPTGVL